MRLFLLSLVILLTACGNGTHDGYRADTTGLNTNTDSGVDQSAAGDRGNPDTSIGATTNAKAPDSNATNPNIR